MIYQIAIDGPAGAGKSTIAKKVAERLGFEYIDTGAMYRAITLKALKLNIDINIEEEFDFIDSTIIDFQNNELYLDGVNVTSEIRSLEVSNNVSQVAKYESVRQKLVQIQQNLANCKNVIMDGRDIGTVVLPNANLKIYLNASVEERAKRRMEERTLANNNTQDLQATILEIKERDYKDSTRKISPLKKAPDAIEIDTSSMSISEVIDKIISLFAKRGNSMEMLEQKDSNQMETDQVEVTDQTPVAKEEKKATKKVKKVKEEKEEVKTEEAVVEETIKEEPKEELKEAAAVEDDLDEDIDHDEDDEDLADDEAEEDDSKAEVRLVKPLQLVTGTVVRVFDAIDAQEDNFGHVLRKARDARILINLDNGLEGLLFTRDIYNYQGEDLHELFPIGKDLSLVVKKVYPDGGRVLLSTTLLKMRENLSQFEEAVKNTEIITAKVIKKLSIGLLLKYKEYSCLLPTSQIVGDASTHDDLIGKDIEVAPIRVDYNRIRLVVSQTVANGKKNRLEKEEFIKTLEVGQVFDGVVKNIETYGAFVQLTPGVEGLLHVSEIAHERVFNVEKVLKTGDQVKVQIINLGDGRIGLSRKSLIPNHWKDLITSLNINDTVKAKVAEINNSGVVVEFDHGVNGFLPKSEFAWEKDVFIEDYIALGDEIELKVIELDLSKKRIILSRKQLQENPWDELTVKPNDTIEVEVAKKLAEGFKVTFGGVMGYLPNINVDQKKIALDAIKEGTVLQVRVRVFDRARTRLIVTMLERETFAPRHKDNNYSKYMDNQEAFTSTFGDLIADSLKKK